MHKGISSYQSPDNLLRDTNTEEPPATTSGIINITILYAVVNIFNTGVKLSEEVFWIPEINKNIWKLGKKSFQIWIALYYCLRNKEQETLELYPGMFKKFPFLITDLKRKSLIDCITQISRVDQSVKIIKRQDGNEGIIHIQILSAQKKIPVPCWFVEMQIFKGKKLGFAYKLPSLLYLLMKCEQKQGFFSINGYELKMFVKNLTGNNIKPSDLFAEFKALKILDYSFNSVNNCFSGKFVSDEFISSQKQKKLRIKAGYFTPGVADNYKIFRNLLGEGGSCDLILASSVLDAIKNIKSGISGNVGKYPEVISEKISSIQNRGRYTFKNTFSDVLKYDGVFCHWFDFSIGCEDKGKSASFSIPKGRYSGGVVAGYFYPGSIVGKDCDKIRFRLNANVECCEKGEIAGILKGYEYAVNSSGVVRNAFQESFVFLCPVFSITEGSLRVDVSADNELEKINFRVLALLINGD